MVTPISQRGQSMVWAVSKNSLVPPENYLKVKWTSTLVTREPAITSLPITRLTTGIRIPYPNLKLSLYQHKGPWANPRDGLIFPYPPQSALGLPPSQRSLGIREMQSQNFTSALPRSSPGRESVLLLISRSFLSRR